MHNLPLFYLFVVIFPTVLLVFGPFGLRKTFDLKYWSRKKKMLLESLSVTSQPFSSVFRCAAFIIQVSQRVCWRVLHRVLGMTHFQVAPAMRIIGCLEAQWAVNQTMLTFHNAWSRTIGPWQCIGPPSSIHCRLYIAYSVYYQHYWLQYYLQTVHCYSYSFINFQGLKHINQPQVSDSLLYETKQLFKLRPTNSDL